MQIRVDVGYMLASTLVTRPGATPSLEAMSISPLTHALDGGLRDKIRRATDNLDIKFLSRLETWWIDVMRRHCKVEVGMKKKIEA
jgi:hypothetical protein